MNANDSVKVKTFWLALGIVLGFTAAVALLVGVAARAKRMPFTEKPNAAAKPVVPVAEKPRSSPEKVSQAVRPESGPVDQQSNLEDEDAVRSAILEFLRDNSGDPGSVRLVRCRYSPGLVPSVVERQKRVQQRARNVLGNSYEWRRYQEYYREYTTKEEHEQNAQDLRDKAARDGATNSGLFSVEYRAANGFGGRGLYSYRIALSNGRIVSAQGPEVISGH